MGQWRIRQHADHPTTFTIVPSMKKILAALSVSLAFAAPAAFAQKVAAPSPAATPAAAPAAAANPAALAAANDMLTAMNYRAVAQGMFAQMRHNMPIMMRQGATNSIINNPKMDEAQKKASMEKMEKQLPLAVNAVDGVFNDPALLNTMMSETANLYARHFTADELRQITAFYKTPVGVKMLASMPQLMNESMQMGQKIVMPRIQAVMQKAQAK